MPPLRTALLAVAVFASAGILAARPAPAEEPKAGGVAFETGVTFADAVAKAKAQGKALFVDFWADG